MSIQFMHIKSFDNFVARVYHYLFIQSFYRNQMFVNQSRLWRGCMAEDDARRTKRLTRKSLFDVPPTPEHLALEKAALVYQKHHQNQLKETTRASDAY